MKIRRTDNIQIVAEFDGKRINPEKRIDRTKWVEFIDSHRDYFIWYEETKNGIAIVDNLYQFTEPVQKGILYCLDRTTVYSTNKIVRHEYDLIISYQQGGRGVTREQIITRLESMIAKDAEAVYKAKPSLWNGIGIDSGETLLKVCREKSLSSKKEFQNIIRITYEIQ